MSTVIVLTPVIIASWPTITAAVAAAAVGLGLTVKEEICSEQESQIENQAEIELENSEVLAKGMAVDKEMVLTRGEITIRVRRDQRGQCRICAEGKGHTKAELKQIAEEFAQKLTQCYAYHQTVSELKKKQFQMVNEELSEDGSIRLHVPRWVD